MQRQAPDWQRTKTNTNQRIKFLLKNDTFRDVLFHVEESGQETKVYPAHMLILSCVSPVLEERFYPDVEAHYRSNLPIDIVENHFTQRAFEAMLAYAYTSNGSAQFMSPPHALETYHVAREYIIEHLKEVCSRFLVTVRLNPEDIIPIYDDEFHVEIAGLNKRCIDVVEKKPLLVMKIAAKTAKYDTLGDLLQMDRLAIPSEIALLKYIVEGARSRQFDERSEIGNLTIFLRQKILPFIRFLTMTVEQFAVAIEICGPAISKQEGFEIFYKLSSPRRSYSSGDFPSWLNPSTKYRVGRDEFGEIIPRNQNLPGSVVISGSLISQLKITAREGDIVISGIWIKYRPMQIRNSAGCRLSVRNESAAIGCDVLKELTMDGTTSEKLLTFPTPLPILCGETGDITLTLNNIEGLGFYQFDKKNLEYVHEDFVADIALFNMSREAGKLFSISKINFSWLYM